jgi:hypothetical protein
LGIKAHSATNAAIIGWEYHLGFGLRVQGSRFWVQELGFRV